MELQLESTDVFIRLSGFVLIVGAISANNVKSIFNSVTFLSLYSKSCFVDNSVREAFVGWVIFNNRSFQVLGRTRWLFVKW